jgi:hypothetical protein
MKFTPRSPLVLSSSALGAFKRCPKSFELNYVRGFQTPTNRAVEEGASFHDMIAKIALGMSQERLIAEYCGQPMLPVVLAYLKYKKLPGIILAAEQPLYTKILPSVWIRTTFDMMYQLLPDSSPTIRDYKTFANAPNLDVELNFQSKLYAALAKEHFGLESPPRFEFEYVRRTPPYVEKDKKGGVWTAEECYKTWPVYVSSREADMLMAETKEVCKRILVILKNWEPSDPRMYRVAQTTSGFSAFSCNGCFVRELCKAEASAGRLSETQIEANTESIRAFPPPLPKGAFGKQSYLATVEESESLR